MHPPKSSDPETGLLSKSFLFDRQFLTGLRLLKNWFFTMVDIANHAEKIKFFSIFASPFPDQKHCHHQFIKQPPWSIFAICIAILSIRCLTEPQTSKT